MTALAALAAYLLGSVPFALIAARTKGIDLRAEGSGNLGATNAIRVLGASVGVPVLLLDILKGVAGAFWIPAALGVEGPGRLLCGAAAVLGHVFPVFLRFRGGKGVATAGGAFLALAPAATGIAIGVFVATLLVFRYVSLASMLAAVALPAALWFTGASGTLRGAGLAIGLLVVVRHRTNLDRIRRGTEGRVPLGRRRNES